MRRRKVTVSWYTDLDRADRDRAREDHLLSPDKRVEEVFRLMQMAGTWEPNGRLDRVARFVTVP